MRPTSPTYVLQYGDICRLSCSGVLPIDPDAELKALDARERNAKADGR